LGSRTSPPDALVVAADLVEALTAPGDHTAGKLIDTVQRNHLVLIHPHEV